MFAPCTGGITVRRFPLPLAFCSGISERELPNQIFMAVHSLQGIERASAIGATMGGTAFVDWAFVIAVLLSFAAGLLTFKSISGELRDNTLTLVLSNPVSRRTVILGKYLAAMLVLAVALIIAISFSLIILMNTGVVYFTGDDWLKIGFVEVVSLFYLSVFVLVGMLCSVITRSPLISAVAFLFNWTFWVFVVPNLGGILAGQIDGVKTPLQIREMADAIPDRYPLKPGISAAEEAEVLLARESARERLLIEYLQSLIRQVHLGQNLTRLSPTSAYSFAVENIIGGGTHRLMHFVGNVVRFREGFLQAMIEADKQDPESEHRYVPWACGGKHFSHRIVDLGPAKEFRDSPPSSTEGLQAAFTDLALLIFYNFILFLITFWRFSRQNVAPVHGM
jgi:ABC-type transport system involved in multi-copper enzyme maturation permease subunit